jgi:hypothetical protein
MGVVLGRDGGTDESMFPQFGIKDGLTSANYVSGELAVNDRASDRRHRRDDAKMAIDRLAPASICFS